MAGLSRSAASIFSLATPLKYYSPAAVPGGSASARHVQFHAARAVYGRAQHAERNLSQRGWAICQRGCTTTPQTSTSTTPPWCSRTWPLSLAEIPRVIQLDRQPIDGYIFPFRIDTRSSLYDGAAVHAALAVPSMSQDGCNNLSLYASCCNKGQHHKRA